LIRVSVGTVVVVVAGSVVVVVVEGVLVVAGEVVVASEVIVVVVSAIGVVIARELVVGAAVPAELQADRNTAIAPTMINRFIYCTHCNCFARLFR
jgi:hypothetical protein